VERSHQQISVVVKPDPLPGQRPGAGPSIFSPSCLNLLPWHGHAMMPSSGFHAVRQPRLRAHRTEREITFLRVNNVDAPVRIERD